MHEAVIANGCTVCDNHSQATDQVTLQYCETNQTMTEGSIYTKHKMSMALNAKASSRSSDNGIQCIALVSACTACTCDERHGDKGRTWGILGGKEHEMGVGVYGLLQLWYKQLPVVIQQPANYSAQSLMMCSY